MPHSAFNTGTEVYGLDNYTLVAGSVIGCVFVFLGVILKTGRRNFKADRKDVSDQEKETERRMGNMLLRLAVCVIVITIAFYLDKKAIVLAAVIIAIVISFVSYLNAYKNKKK